MTRRANDLGLYERHADQWWNPRSRAFRSLHGVNRFRRALLEEWLPDVQGWRTVDLGCGGGLLSEALVERGARVLGVDLSHASLAAARRAPGATASGRGYVRGDLRRAPVADACADLVLLADVLEHVEPWPLALAEASRLLAAGGHLYVNTITRSPLSRLLAVTLAEGLGLVPGGTHDPALFVRPEELRAEAGRLGLQPVRFQAESPAVLQTLRRRALALRPAARLTAAYSLLLQKDAAP